MKAVYHPEFKASFDVAFRYYRNIGLPLAERFRSEVRAGVRQIVSGLVHHAPGPHGFRCYRCNTFPYLVYYEPQEDAVLLLAVVYKGRSPDMLRDALPKH